MDFFDEKWKRETESIDLEEEISGEALQDPYDVTFVSYNGESYEYIRRYITSLDPTNVENGIIENLLINDNTTSVDPTTGALVVNGGVGILGNLNVGGGTTISGITTITNSTQSTTKDTGALVVDGGVGIEKNLYVGGNFIITGTIISDGNSSIGSTQDSFDKDTGAFIVEGGVGIEKSLNVGGNVFVTGISTFVGNVDFRGGTNGNIVFGDTSGDNVVFNADVNSNIIPNITNTYDLGSITQRWRDGYFEGSVTANTFIGNAINGSTLELLRGNMAANDQFRILIGGIDDVGYVEIATGDNGNEPIYVRQYTYDPITFEPFFTLNRTATLLDEFGNTGFPGIVTATTFVGNGITPIGGIIMWSGTIAEAILLEPGWSLCDGRTVNGRTTPDLRDRFIIGASVDSEGLSTTTITGVSTKTGGSKDAVVVQHTHTASTDIAGAHYHQLRDGGGGDNTNSITAGGGNLSGQDNATVLRDLPDIMSTEGAHAHIITVDSTGESGIDKNLPPYFALAFIMRTA